jgi:hypothetical protein
VSYFGLVQRDLQELQGQSRLTLTACGSCGDVMPFKTGDLKSYALCPPCFTGKYEPVGEDDDGEDH